jgi:hypothetical protein
MHSKTPGLAALRMWAKAATGSPKNITPNAATPVLLAINTDFSLCPCT